MTDPLTVAQYTALGEPGRAELVEGRLVPSPAGLPAHNYACGNLITQIAAQLPGELEVVYALDVDLGLGPSDGPGFVRRPDLVVCPRKRADLLKAADVVVAVEVLSPHSRYTDCQAKRLEYAQAGIRSYWIVDLAPLSLTSLRLEDGVYVDAPVHLRIELEQLIG
ncbi:Uma2 family endonuclease [Lentzea sp. NPDC003310]|uniref:Uma2 family endonuclease n=1 Tax=Lentzea sp. NPDC003310 TaxID=3154447 RepID=UPI0033B74551